MFPSIESLEELVSHLSKEAREIVGDCPLIIDGPPKWDIILATHERLSPSTMHFPRTSEFTFENLRKRATKKRQRVTIHMAGGTEDFQNNGVKLVLQLPGSASLFIYLYDQRRREGHLIDVNFIRHAANLQVGQAVGHQPMSILAAT